MTEEIITSEEQEVLQTAAPEEVLPAEAAPLPERVTVADIQFRSGSKVYFFDPGELTVKSGDHVIVFLYYVDSFKTKMMIIEQGGNGSTVICSIFDRTWFTSRGYMARRQIGFAQ